jgi:predicted dehydrogenase
MPLRVGFLSTAHMHAWGYSAGVNACAEADLAGIWDEDEERASAFAAKFEAPSFSSAEELLSVCDAVVICSENKKHPEHVEWAARAGKPILCEKPIVTSSQEWDLVKEAVLGRGVPFMTAFPCRYSPAFRRLKERFDAGEIGKLVAICATNRGRNPGGWFIQPEVSGGGAMIDHVVHVADLLWVLLGERPSSVYAATGNNMYGQNWEDTAMLTMEVGDGVFATLDSSWSRPKSYKTWGDVTMSIVGEYGVLELDMFNQAVEHYSDATGGHGLAGYGSDLDSALIADFVKAVRDGRPPAITADDGWQAVRVALAGYESAASGKPISL